ncbi:Inactive pancreatic lipase-related protein 1 [Halotydeus destructor]|nr:Inactive pancreatic lipase-related protein 1 [Halotydeus destructor]
MKSKVKRDKLPSAVLSLCCCVLLFCAHVQCEHNLLGTILSGRANDIFLNTMGTFGSMVSNCLVNRAGWADEELGEFYADDRYCDSRCLRNLVCCAPQRPEELGVQFLLTNSRYENQLLSVDDKDVISYLDPKRVVIVVHGFLNHYNYESIWNETRNAWVARGANAIMVDWSRGNRLYMQSMANVRVIGALIGQLVRHLGVSHMATCVGFSLGSHICGEAGHWLKERRIVLSQCHGVDPAGPGFDGCGPEIRLDPSDCGVVTSLHTSQFNDFQGFGTQFKSGHCDFWLNDGLPQPECGSNPVTADIIKSALSLQVDKMTGGIENLVGCSHVRAMRYYLSQLNGACNYQGVRALCGGNQACLTFRSDASSLMTMTPDDRCTPFSDVDFKISTTGYHPYC